MEAESVTSSIWNRDSPKSTGASDRRKSKKKRTVRDLLLLGDRRKSAEEIIRWNYSFIDAALQLLLHLRIKSRKILDDLWIGAVMCGISEKVNDSAEAGCS